MYIESYHAYEVKYGTILMPKKSYKEYELQAGKSPIIEVTDEELEKLKSMPEFASLLKNRQYRILETMPKKYLSGNNRIKALETDNIKKNSEIEELKAKIKDLEENNGKETSKKDSEEIEEQKGLIEE